MKENVLVIYGGCSSEHDVSIVTAVSFLKRNKDENYNFIPCYVSRTGEWFCGDELLNFSFYRKFNSRKLSRVVMMWNDKNLYKLTRGKIKKFLAVDFVANCCHGGDGENGNLGALFVSAGVPLTNGSSCGMGIAMNKKLFKYYSLARDIPTIDFFCVEKSDWLVNRIDILRQLTNFDFPVVVKPCSQGSSVGVAFAENYEQFEKAIRFAFLYDTQVVVERAIKNKREFNCCVMRTRSGVVASEIDEPITDKVVVSFEDKYLEGRSSGKSLKGASVVGAMNLNMENAKRKFPAELPKELKKKIQKYSTELFLGLEMNGVVRVDFIFDKDDKKLYVGEVNSIPGSLGYYFFSENDFVSNLIEGAKQYWKEQNIQLPEGYKIFN